AIWCQSDTVVELEPAGDLSRRKATFGKALAARSRILKRLMGWVDDRACAKDLLHETYQRVLLLEPSSLEKIESIEDYLYAVAKNVAREHLLEKARESRLFYQDGGRDVTSPDAAETLGGRLDSAHLLELMERLPRHYQDALRLSV